MFTLTELSKEKSKKVLKLLFHFITCSWRGLRFLVLTFLCKLFLLTPRPVRWPRCHRRCAFARSPSATRPFSQLQTPNCPARQEGTCEELPASFSLPKSFALKGQSSAGSNASRTGPTNPSKPERTKGTSPTGEPEEFTGITCNTREDTGGKAA